MRLPVFFVLFALSLFDSNAAALPDGLVYARNGSGAYGYKDTPKLPWCEFLVHDPDRPEPRRIDPGPSPQPAPAPSDAVALFAGKDLSQWTDSRWNLEK